MSPLRATPRTVSSAWDTEHLQMRARQPDSLLRKLASPDFNCLILLVLRSGNASQATQSGWDDVTYLRQGATLHMPTSPNIRRRLPAILQAPGWSSRGVVHHTVPSRTGRQTTRTAQLAFRIWQSGMTSARSPRPIESIRLISVSSVQSEVIARLCVPARLVNTHSNATTAMFDV